MTKAQRAIKEASDRVAAYKFDIKKYPSLASSKIEAKNTKKKSSKKISQKN